MPGADGIPCDADDLLKRDFKAHEPLAKAVTDITEIKVSDGKLYVSALFDCFDPAVRKEKQLTTEGWTISEEALLIPNHWKGHPDLPPSITSPSNPKRF